MLEKLDDDIAHCLAKATAAAAEATKAEHEGREEDRVWWREREKAWMQLAESYAFTKRISRKLGP